VTDVQEISGDREDATAPPSDQHGPDDEENERENLNDGGEQQHVSLLVPVV
jgi:hypothetical protein